MSEFVLVKRELLESHLNADSVEQLKNTDAELRAVLAQEAMKCEPVARMHSGTEGDCCIWFSRPPDGTLLYAPDVIM